MSIPHRKTEQPLGLPRFFLEIICIFQYKMVPVELDKTLVTQLAQLI